MSASVRIAGADRVDEERTAIGHADIVTGVRGQAREFRRHRGYPTAKFDGGGAAS